MYEAAIQETIRSLSSPEARKSLEADPYWPKWDSPWWQMLLLYEMGLTDQIPKAATEAMIKAIQRQYVPNFFAADVPPGRDPSRDTFCHCGLGTLFQVLSASGANVDDAIPWARSWFFKYQMADGGLNCDEGGYRANPPASSMVATIAPLEAVLNFTARPFTPEEEKFLDAGAAFLIERRLMLGSSSDGNAEERLDEPDWLKPCFPRFYFYDILRGLSFLIRWAELRRKPIPTDAVEEALSVLSKKFPSGEIRIERNALEGVDTQVQAVSGRWERRPMAGSFPLLAEVSQVGEVSPYLTKQWRETQEKIEKLMRLGSK